MKNEMRRWEIWLANRIELEIDFKNYLRKEIIREIEPNIRLSKAHINKAFHNLDFANFTLKEQNKINRRNDAENYFDWVIIISYYSMYHAATALLYKLGYKTSAHLATICVLSKECLGRTLKRQDIEKLSALLELSEEEIKEIGRAKERREKASYSGSISFEKELAELTIMDAQSFVNKIADIIEE